MKKLEVYFPEGMSGNGIRNFYDELPEHLKQITYNPNYKDHELVLPFRMLIVAPSGQGKTNLALNIIFKFNNGELDTFNSITIITLNSNEPLYDYMKEKYPLITFIDGINNIPNIDDIDKSKQHLVILDDMMLEKNQDTIEQYFNRGRKLNISTIYLTQKFHEVPITIRVNLNYVVLMKMPHNERNKVLHEFKKKDENFLKMYEQSISQTNGFFLIKCTEDQYRQGFLGRFTCINPIPITDPIPEIENDLPQENEPEA